MQKSFFIIHNTTTGSATWYIDNVRVDRDVFALSMLTHDVSSPLVTKGTINAENVRVEYAIFEQRLTTNQQ